LWTHSVKVAVVASELIQFLAKGESSTLGALGQQPNLDLLRDPLRFFLLVS
jgi:hypothetical protein